MRSLSRRSWAAPVIGIDKAKAKVDLIGAGRSPVVEQEIDEIVRRNVERGYLTATSDVTEAVKCSDMSIVCVGTPSRRNGALGLSAIEAVSTEIGEAIRSKSSRHEVVVLLHGIAGHDPQRHPASPYRGFRKGPGDAFGVAFHPEFMREGSSVADFNTPSRTIVGALEERSTQAVMALHSHLPGGKISTDIETAELVKYVDNTWHALKVAFTNEIAVVASTLGIDSDEVMRIFAEDQRLNISRSICGPALPLAAHACRRICGRSLIRPGPAICRCR